MKILRNSPLQSLGLALLCAFATLASCTKKPFKDKLEVQHFDPRFSEYISAYSNGAIGRKSAIKVRFTKDVAEVGQVGKEAPSGLLSFSPKLEGTTRWLDSRTLEFKPKGLLPSGEVYTAEVDVDAGFDDVPSDLETFGFQVYTLPQEIGVELAYVQPQSERSLDWMKLEADVKTEQLEEGKALEQIFEITGAKGGSKPHWTHSKDGRTHHLRLDSLKRDTQPYSLTFRYNGEAIGSAQQEEFKVEVPAKGQFKLVAHKAYSNPEQVLLLAFSDPLQPGQDLTGLIHSSDKSGYRFSIEGSVVRAYPTGKAAAGEAAGDSSATANGSAEEASAEQMQMEADRWGGNPGQAPNASSPITVHLDAGIRNLSGQPLSTGHQQFPVQFQPAYPEVKLFGNGGIIPTSENVPLSFEAVNLRAVDVQVTKVYESNIPYFFERSNLVQPRGYYDYVENIGQVVFEKKVRLDEDPTVNLSQWSTHTLDLAKIIKADPGAIYSVKIRFRSAYSLYNCGDKPREQSRNRLLTHGKEKLWDYYDNYEYLEGDAYGEGPCYFSYFRNETAGARCNVLSSDLGMLAKQDADGNLLFVLSDLKTLEPVKDAKISVYSNHKQVIGTVTTDADGFARMRTEETLLLAIAEKEKQKGYLKLNGSPLNVSRFDLSGESSPQGVKGMIYTERSVWRPGDSIFVSFILEDRRRALPIDHPITFEMTNPRGQVVQKMMRNSSLNGLYTFPTATELQAPTGTYHITISAGGLRFEKNLKVETIMPNRLKLELPIPKPYLTPEDTEVGTLTSRWLHGAPAQGLVAEVSLTMTRKSEPFPKFKDFLFFDSTRRFTPEPRVLFRDNLSEQGTASIPFRDIGTAPGPMNLFFTGKVYERGGSFSTNVYHSTYSPFPTYVGLKLPKEDPAAASGYEPEYYESDYYSPNESLKAGRNHTIELLSVDRSGKPVTGNVSVSLYFTQYRYWYEYNQSETAYTGTTASELVSTTPVTLTGGKGSYSLNIPRQNIGVYFLRVCHPSGHCTGKVFTIEEDYYGQNLSTKAGTTLTDITTSKPSYKAGEEAELRIPSPLKGRALVSIETGSRILKTEWVETTAPTTVYRFKVTAEMAPNVYAYVNVVQPHAQTTNDLPMRLYGVVPVLVENPASHLQPLITLPKVLLPESTTQLKVSEKNGKPMTYTVAVVDEGLLDLTRFTTPDPWPAFYQREAYTNRTWDLYDLVLGFSNLKTGSLLTLGGDEGKIAPDAGSKVQRFKPMVRFFGPFHLRAGQTATHKLPIPQYVGSVRTMVIARENEAYGSAEVTTPVRKPLMILGTLPRVLGPGEEVELPVNVFAMERSVKDVTVDVKLNNLLVPQSQLRKSLSFTATGEQLITFPLKVQDRIGIAKVEITARSGKETARYNVELEVRAPNPEIARTSEEVIQDQKEHVFTYAAFGMPGTNRGKLELSTLPSLNLEQRLTYLMQYPHGCIEQTVSGAFPQLFVLDLAQLSPAERTTMERNVKAALRRLTLFQLSDGGFSYWPGQSYEGADDWGTNYAGHFLLEAQQHGYAIPAGLLEGWQRYEKRRANAWTPLTRKEVGYDNSDLMQAYRLYLLSAAKAPELGAMNRLREKKNLELTARWQLASAYYLAGQPSIATALTRGQSTEVPAYRELGFTYGSGLRDRAIILEALAVMRQQSRLFPLMRSISNELKSDQWLSTQETAYSLLALSKAGLASGTPGLDLQYSLNGGAWQTVKTKSALVTVPLLRGADSASPRGTIADSQSPRHEGTIRIRNRKGGVLFSSLVLRGIPAAGGETAEQSKLEMDVTYRTMGGMPLDVTELEQGTDFIAEVRMKNPTVQPLEAMALSMVFPSGWQLYNARLEGQDLGQPSSQPDYADIRDDRQYLYFALAPKLAGNAPRYESYIGNGEAASDEKVFRIVLNASYVGRFYLPSTYCEAMYDRSFHAATGGKWVRVVKGKRGV